MTPAFEGHTSAPIPSGLPQIGKGAIVQLRVAGIQTAWDVLEAGPDGHEDVPGLGPGKWTILRDWCWDALTFEEREHVMILWDTGFDANVLFPELIVKRGTLASEQRAILEKMLLEEEEDSDKKAEAYTREVQRVNVTALLVIGLVVAGGGGIALWLASQ
ncbi:MAG: hypothetical protein Q8P41_05135 [Pseudomonadota bacterium]|nr:hypothetical protein [Pseudomonadota bacterium]